MPKSFISKDMEPFWIDGIAVYLISENGGIRIKTDENNVLLVDQKDIEAVEALIESNFRKVSDHYKSILTTSNMEVDLEDLNKISLNIVLHYLHMYNAWRKMYKREQNRSLQFEEKDFAQPSTYDLIFFYLKSKYPNEWGSRSAALLGMNVKELMIYYKKREEYYNK